MFGLGTNDFSAAPFRPGPKLLAKLLLAEGIVDAGRGSLSYHYMSATEPLGRLLPSVQEIPTCEMLARDWPLMVDRGSALVGVFDG